MIKFVLFVWVILTSLNAHSQPDSDYQIAWRSAKDALPNTKIDMIEKTDVQSLYAIHAGDNLFYYDPVSRVVMFGEMFDQKGGLFTTSKHSQPFDQRLLNSAGKAIIVNPGANKHTIIEFLSPSCSHCESYIQYISSRKDVKRIVFFVTNGEPASDRKLNHVLCAKSPSQNMSSLMSSDLAEQIDCQEAEISLAEHRRFADKLGVVTTPLLIVNGHRIEGFQQQKLNQLLN